MYLKIFIIFSLIFFVYGDYNHPHNNRLIFLENELSNQTAQAQQKIINLVRDFEVQYEKLYEELQHHVTIYNNFKEKLNGCKSDKCLEIVAQCVSKCWCLVEPSCECCWACANCMGNMFFSCCHYVFPPRFCPSKK